MRAGHTEAGCDIAALAGLEPASVICEILKEDGSMARLPDLEQFAKTHGLDPLLVGMTWTFGAGGKLFAYQSAVLIVGLSYGYFSSRDLLKLGFLLTLVECAVLLLLVFFYWPLIGIR